MVVDPTTTTKGSIVAYAATVGGGVWKTTNCCSNTTSGAATTDDPLISTLAIDTLASIPNDHNTVYAGTGDLNYGSFSMGSQGILKSTDAGAPGPCSAPTSSAPRTRSRRASSRSTTRSARCASTRTTARRSWPERRRASLSPTTAARLDRAVLDQQLPDPAAGHHRPRAREHGRRRHADHRRGRRPRLRHDRAVRPRQQRRERALQRQHAVERLPELHVDRVERERVRLRPAVTGSPYTTGAAMNAGSGTRTSTRRQATSSAGSTSRSPRATRRSSTRRCSRSRRTRGGCGGAAGCQLGVWATTNGGTSWTFMAGSQGPALERRLRLRLPAELVRPGARGRPEQRRPPLRRHVRRLVRDPHGTTLTDLTCGYRRDSGHVVHVDQHALAFVPGSSSILLVGSDGGAFSTSNAAGRRRRAPTWFNMDTGFNTIEFYSGDISGYFATSPNPSAAGGAQDNAPSVVGFTGYPTGPVQWQMTVGGDGFYARIDPVGSGAGEPAATSSATTAAACPAASRTASLTCRGGGSGYGASAAAGPATRSRSSCPSTSSTAASRAATTVRRPARRAAAVTSSTGRPGSGRRSRAATPR